MILRETSKTKAIDHRARLHGFMITVHTHSHKRKRSETLRTRPQTLAPTLSFPYSDPEKYPLAHWSVDLHAQHGMSRLCTTEPSVATRAAPCSYPTPSI